MERSPGSGIFWPERLVGWLLLSVDQSGCWGNGGPRAVRKPGGRAGTVPVRSTSGPVKNVKKEKRFRPKQKFRQYHTMQYSTYTDFDIPCI